MILSFENENNYRWAQEAFRNLQTQSSNTNLQAFRNPQTHSKSALLKKQTNKQTNKQKKNTFLSYFSQFYLPGKRQKKSFNT